MASRVNTELLSKDRLPAGRNNLEKAFRSSISFGPNSKVAHTSLMQLSTKCCTPATTCCSVGPNWPNFDSFLTNQGDVKPTDFERCYILRGAPRILAPVR